MLSNDLATRLEGAPARQIADRLGITPAQASSAIGTVLPLLLGALGRNTSQPQGAQDLFGALQEHAGQDIGHVVDASLSERNEGNAILGHVFGERQPHAAEAIGQATGLGQDKAHMLLRWLAPIVMAYLAKRVFDARHATNAADIAATPTADAAGGTPATPPSPQGLGEVLQDEAAQARQQHGGLLDAVLGGLGAHGGALGGLLKMGESVLGDRPTR